jgi:hypothetical protein
MFIACLLLIYYVSPSAQQKCMSKHELSETDVCILSGYYNKYAALLYHSDRCYFAGKQN